uniref:Uncharacterized protein n=1 Tax=Eutreptiella gymnastica TaxID=73025 RepID=A0A7S4LC73_9EUGL
MQSSLSQYNFVVINLCTRGKRLWQALVQLSYFASSDQYTISAQLDGLLCRVVQRSAGLKQGRSLSPCDGQRGRGTEEQNSHRWQGERWLAGSTHSVYQICTQCACNDTPFAEASTLFFAKFAKKGGHPLPNIGSNTCVNVLCDDAFHMRLTQAVSVAACVRATFLHGPRD